MGKCAIDAEKHVIFLQFGKQGTLRRVTQKLPTLTIMARQVKKKRQQPSVSDEDNPSEFSKRLALPFVVNNIVKLVLTLVLL